MAVLGSLTNRIFLASAALAVVSIAAAISFVSWTTRRDAEAELQRGLIEAGALVDQQCATLVQTFTVMARLVADSPRLKAAVDTGDAPTVRPLAREYREQLQAAALVLTGRSGQVLAQAMAGEGETELPEHTIPLLPEIRQALGGREAGGFWPHGDGMLQVITVPIVIGLDRPDIMGTLTVGFRLDHDLAARFKRATESDIAFAVNGRIRAATLPVADRPRLTELIAAPPADNDVYEVALAAGDYVALKRPLVPASSASSMTAPASGAPTVLLLRSRTERLRFLSSVNAALAVVGMLAVLAATILSYAVARTVTHPIGAITAVMREMTKTGDLTRKIALSRSASWEDEDAKLLASTFNTLTDSIARFQREAAQRERLSALGRLSTVVAHEIRNPLMIIKASLRTLEQDTASRAEVKLALADVHEEVARLNRVVNDVLDFARPIRFDLAPADVNAVCAEAEQATRTGHEGMRVRITTDPAVSHVVTDAERLRTALVNILTNARQAVAARAAREGHQAAATDPMSAPDIDIETSASGSTARIAVRDRGIGVAPGDLPRVFDPYFTTRRTGSGLGLAIARNIIDGLGGVISLNPREGGGTEITIDLPGVVPGVAPGAAPGGAGRPKQGDAA